MSQLGYLALKFGLSAAIIVAVSEIAKRSSLFGGLVASLPLVSLLAFVWLYLDTRDTARVASLSTSIFWLVLPSLALFLLLPWALRSGFGFWPSLGIGVGGTLVCYGAMLLGLRVAGISL